MIRFVPRLVAVAVSALLALSAFAEPPTPKDPKSPIPGCVDGRGPTGPVDVKIHTPKPGEVIPIPRMPVGQTPAKGATIDVTFEMKNYETFFDPKCACGQGLALVLDNGPTAVNYDMTRSWRYPKVLPGTHTIRAFPVRPWGESIKEPGAFAMVTFSVGEKNGKNSPDPKGPLLTVSSPRGRYPKGEKVLLDFLVSGCTVDARDVPDSCRVRYRIDELPEVILTAPDPVWITGLTVGRHAYVIGLTRGGKLIEGPFILHQGVFEVVDSSAAAAAPKAGAPAP